MENLPVEVIVNIYKLLFERDRRSLKLVSKLFHDCYRSFVFISRKQPPAYLAICPYALVERPCNAVRKCSGPLNRDSMNIELFTVYHDCMCGRMAVIGAFNEWVRRRNNGRELIGWERY